MSEPTNEPTTVTGVIDDADVNILSENPITKKQKTLTSDVWKDFNRVVKGDITQAICKHCKKKLVGGGTHGTSHLRGHLKRCLKACNRDITQQMVNVKEKNGIVRVENFQFDAKRSRMDLARMVILHELPFLFAEYAGFRVFVRNLQPLYPIRGRKTLKSDCIEVYEEEKVKMYDKIEHVKGRISITSDMWTSCQNLGYMVLTSHYIDEDWKLQKKILNFLQVDVPHNAERLSETVMGCLMEWNIDGKLFAMSLDNCSVNDCMANKISEHLNSMGVLIGGGKFFHIRCAAHILNLIVQDGWNSLGGGSKGCALEKIRESVKFVTISQKREHTFNEVVKKLRIGCNKALVTDCPTRWNSTYDMLNIALEYREAFSRLQYSDKEYKLTPSKEEWDMTKSIADCLKIFHKTTNLFSGTKYPTSNVFFHEICEINLAITSWSSSSKDFIRTMAANMRVKFEKYWGTCHSSLAISAILDPQFKMKLVEYYFPKIYGIDDAPFQIAVIKETFDSLYHEYALNSPSQIFQKSTSEEENSEVIFDGSVGSETNSGFDAFIQETSWSQATKRDVDYYLEEPVLPRNQKFDILSWWKVNEAKYPILSHMARDMLGIPVSTVASESAFSTGGRVLDKYRSSLSPKSVQALICAQDWIKDEFKDCGSKAQPDDFSASCVESIYNVVVDDADSD